MTVPFSGLITPDGTMSFNTPDGKNHIITSAHISYTEIKQTLRDLQAARQSGDTTLADDMHEQLAVLVKPAQRIVQASAGRVTVADGAVFFEGEELHNTLVDRIIWTMQEGFEVQPMLLFLDDMMDNTSNRVVTQLYSFMEKARMGITEDGCLLAYKRVRDDFMDIYTGTVDNSPGQIVTMKRQEVNDNPNETCSHGLHFCSMSYLPRYGAHDGNKVIIVKVKPSDVVSIPTDYNHTKARCCRYVVLGEYEGDDTHDLLATKPVWRETEFRPSYEVDDDDACSDCGSTEDYADGYCNVCDYDSEDDEFAGGAEDDAAICPDCGSEDEYIDGLCEACGYDDAVGSRRVGIECIVCRAVPVDGNCFCIEDTDTPDIPMMVDPLLDRLFNFPQSRPDIGSGD